MRHNGLTISCDATVARNHELHTTEKLWSSHRAIGARRCALYAGAIPGLADFFYIISVTSSCDIPKERSFTLFDIQLHPTINDGFWLVNTANDGRVALPFCSDIVTPVATSRQILNRSNCLATHSAVNFKGTWPRRAPAVHAAGAWGPFIYLFVCLFIFKFSRGSCLGCLNAIYGPERSCNWPKSSYKVAQTGLLDGRVTSHDHKTSSRATLSESSLTHP